MQIRMQLDKICSLSFLDLKKTEQIAQKYKFMELIQIYLQLRTISLHFFGFSTNFYLLGPDPGGKMNADPCGAGSPALIFLQFYRTFKSSFFETF